MDFSAGFGQVKGEGRHGQSADAAAEGVHQLQSVPSVCAEVGGALHGGAMEEIIGLDLEFQKGREKGD